MSGSGFSGSKWNNIMDTVRRKPIRTNCRLGPNDHALASERRFPTQSSPATNDPQFPHPHRLVSLLLLPTPSPPPRRSPATAMAPAVAAAASAVLSQAMRDRQVLDSVGTTAAALSLAGSSFIVLCYLLFRELRKFSFKLVFYLAVSDMFCSLFTILGALTSEQYCGLEHKVLHLITFYLPLWGAILYNGFTYYEVNRMLNNATRMAAGISDRSNQSDIRADKKAFNRWGYYPLILIGSWSFATINRLYDFANPSHKIFWLSFLDIGFAGLMGLFNSIAYGLNSSVRRAISERMDIYKELCFLNFPASARRNGHLWTNPVSPGEDHSCEFPVFPFGLEEEQSYELPHLLADNISSVLSSLMAAAHGDPSEFALPVAAGFFYQLVQILQLLLGFLEGSAARGPAFDAAVTAVLLAVVVAYAIIIGGVVLVHGFVQNTAAAAPLPPAAMWRLFAQAITWISALFLVIGMLLLPFFIDAAGCR
ncbi:hypothetical protein PR202_ga17846 [Eleusine coracana subsp. coracana]|uniref:G-protein coupled receptors family 2 profile 2 domain-containing protein n=1 Tax=Eleusine coracana subsp. coracana TaxID=191504 RepID=A0AAV5CR53_ELECO|nr:hypothetical protein PR202_ga17846 [Eleusine coracana subsp. coracana]